MVNNALLRELERTYLCIRSWLMLRQALIKNIQYPIKDRIYPNSFWKPENPISVNF